MRETRGRTKAISFDNLKHNPRAHTHSHAQIYTRALAPSRWSPGAFGKAPLRISSAATDGASKALTPPRAEIPSEVYASRKPLCIMIAIFITIIFYSVRILLAPHTSGPRDVPRCGALSLLQKDAALQGGSSRNRCRLNVKLWTSVTAR